jgi:nodulation protein E
VRIVITGLGGICGLGTDARTIWEGMREGRCGISELALPYQDEMTTTHGGAVTELPDRGLTHRDLVTMDRFAHLGVLAAGEALAQSGLDLTRGDNTRYGVAMGTGVFGFQSVEDCFRDRFINGKQRPPVFSVPRAMPSSPAVQVSLVHKLRGPVFGITSACASSNHAFASAMDQLRLGRADVMVAGGTDAPLVLGSLKGWESLRILAKTVCRPFSLGRDGLALGDGAAVAVIETLDHAKARGADILAELVGAGMSGDANDIVAPTLEGPVAAMRACLKEAGLNASEVDYINAHGTGTAYNDRMETQAIRTVFGAHVEALSVSSTKSSHAHCLGASGALELIACVNAIRENVVPPTINYLDRDPDCDLDVTPNVARERRVDVAVSNAFAFGGANAVVAVRRFV